MGQEETEATDEKKRTAFHANSSNNNVDDTVIGEADIHEKTEEADSCATVENHERKERSKDIGERDIELYNAKQARYDFICCCHQIQMKLLRLKPKLPKSMRMQNATIVAATTSVTKNIQTSLLDSRQKKKTAKKEAMTL